jgi:O-antigen/teichoic acid export membrane protein
MSSASSIRSNIIWSFVRNFGIRFGSMAVFFVLARILDPSELGVFATVLAVIAFFEVLAEGGIGDAIIQRKDADQKAFATGFAINLVLGVILSGFIIIFASQISYWLNISGATDLLRVAAIGLLLNAASFVPQAYYRRNFDFKWLALRALIGAVLSGIVGILLALMNAGPWAMAAQFITVALVNTIMIWWKKPFKPSLDLSKCDVRSLSSFGAAVMMSRLVYFASTRAIEIVIAISFGPVAIALYVMGNRIVSVAQQLLSAVTLDVYLPRFSRLVENKEKLFHTFFQAIEATSAIAFPIFAGLYIVAPEVVFIAFGENGKGSEDILQILAVLAGVQSITFYCATLLNAVGHPYISLMFQAFRVSILVIVFYIYSDDGLLSLVYAFFGVWVGTAPIKIILTQRVVGFSLWEFFNRVYPYFFASVFMLFFVDLLRYQYWVVDLLLIVKFAFFVVVGVLVYSSFLFVLFRARFKIIINLIFG